ncbi:MAG: hypothetical protein ACIAQ0_01955 [Phycisphaerales bacterium JB058]
MGVAYGTDTNHVRQLLYELVQQNSNVVEDPRPTEVVPPVGGDHVALHVDAVDIRGTHARCVRPHVRREENHRPLSRELEHSVRARLAIGHVHAVLEHHGLLFIRDRADHSASRQTYDAPGRHDRAARSRSRQGVCEVHLRGDPADRRSRAVLGELVQRRRRNDRARLDRVEEARQGHLGDQSRGQVDRSRLDLVGRQIHGHRQANHPLDAQYVRCERHRGVGLGRRDLGQVGEHLHHIRPQFRAGAQPEHRGLGRHLVASKVHPDVVIQHHPVHGDRARVVRPRPRPEPRECDLPRDGFDRELNVSEAVALRKRRGG